MIDKVHTFHANEFLLLGANVPHRVVAKEGSKDMFVKIKS